MTQLRLPFAYDAAILPGPRHQHARPATLRADAFVEVPDLSGADVEEVILLPRAGSWRHWRAPVTEPQAIVRLRGGDGRLLAPVLYRGKPMAAAEFEAQLRLGNARPWEFDLHQYPVAASRHRSPATTPPMLPSFGAFSRGQGWPLPKVVSSDLGDAEGRAVPFLQKALALVDGEVYAECQEPVWTIRRIDRRRHELSLMRQPWADCAHACFRLDRRDQALEYAWSRGWRIDLFSLAVPIEIVVADAVERDDPFEVGSAAAKAWPRLKKCLFAYRKGNPKAFPRELGELYGGGGEPDRWAIARFMDVLAELLAGAGRGVNTSAELYGELGAIVEGSRRWEFERPGIDLFAYAELSDDDIDALQGLAGP